MDLLGSTGKAEYIKGCPGVLQESDGDDGDWDVMISTSSTKSTYKRKQTIRTEDQPSQWLRKDYVPAPRADNTAPVNAVASTDNVGSASG